METKQGEFNGRKVISKRRQISVFAAYGVFLFFIPLLMSFIEFSDTPSVSITDGMLLLFLTPVMFVGLIGTSCKKLIQFFLYSLIPLLVIWFFGFAFMVTIREYAVDWLIVLCQLGTTAVGCGAVSLFVIWLMTHPASKE